MVQSSGNDAVVVGNFDTGGGVFIELAAGALIVRRVTRHRAGGCFGLNKRQMIGAYVTERFGDNIIAFSALDGIVLGCRIAVFGMCYDRVVFGTAFGLTGMGVSVGILIVPSCHVPVVFAIVAVGLMAVGADGFCLAGSRAAVAIRRLDMCRVDCAGAAVGAIAVRAPRGPSVTVVDGYGYGRLVASLVGCDHRLLTRCRSKRQLAVRQSGVLAVHRHEVQIFVRDGQRNGCAVGLIVIRAVNDRSSRIQHDAVCAQIGYIARVIGNLCIDNELCIRLDTKGIFICGKGLTCKLLNAEIVGSHKILHRLNAAADVVCRDGHRLRILIEQSEGDGVPEVLPEGALVDTDLTGGHGLVYLVVFRDHLGDDAAFLVPHIEVQRAVVGFLRHRQGIDPLTLCGVGIGKLPAVLRRNNKVAIQPIVGVDLVFALVGGIGNNIRRDTSGLDKSVVPHIRAGKRKLCKADSNILARCHAGKARRTAHKSHILTAYNAAKRRSITEGRLVRAVIGLVRNRDIDGQFFLFNGKAQCFTGKLLAIFCRRYGQLVFARVGGTGESGQTCDNGIFSVLALFLPFIRVCCTADSAAAGYHSRVSKHNGIAVVDLCVVGHLLAAVLNKQLSGNNSVEAEL